MQYYVDGFRPGDPDIKAPAHVQFNGSAMPETVDVLIAGCGPAGLCLAAQLASFPQISTMIVDPKHGPMEKGQADGVSVRSMEMFQAFGFAEKIKREAYWVNQTTFWRPDAANADHIARVGIAQDVADDQSEMPHTIVNQARRPDHALQGEHTPWSERLKALSGIWPFVLLFGLIIGGLYAKLFTPTEAAGMGAGLAILIATFHGRLTWSVLRTVIIDTAYTSVSLYAVLFGALMLSKLLTLSGLAAGVLALVQSTGLEGYALIFAIMLVFLVLGCVMDSVAIILIFVPLFAPIVVSQGFDLVWFGIIVIVVTEIALVTPPVGMNVFVLKAVLPDVPVVRIFKGLVPFIAVDLVRLALLVAFPAITLWLGSTIS